ncbi:MAG: DUF2149 domain-containing protein [Coriobacteriales bacterium]|jgi:hypothetical protein|nr:DUF2149 domain-containing protein [Coriobacteriales bacterium]
MPRSFRGSGFITSEVDSAEDADPRIGLVNLADVMLVFACGLMLALVTYWNLDVSSLSEVVQTRDVTEVTDIEDLNDETLGSGSGYTELGTVYRDPMTGKLYMITEDLEGAQAPASSEGAPPSPSAEDRPPSSPSEGAPQP